MIDDASSLRIAPAAQSELEAIVRIDRCTLRSRDPQKTYADELAREWSNLEVLVDDSAGGEVVAFINYWVVSDEVHLLSLATDPGHQGQGHGRRLMARLLNVAAAGRCRCITLEVRRSNQGAIAFYERFGFALVAVRSGYYADNGEDALVMLLDTSGRDLD